MGLGEEGAAVADACPRATGVRVQRAPQHPRSLPPRVPGMSCSQHAGPGLTSGSGRGEPFSRQRQSGGHLWRAFRREPDDGGWHRVGSDKGVRKEGRGGSEPWSHAGQAARGSGAGPAGLAAGRSAHRIRVSSCVDPAQTPSSLSAGHSVGVRAPGRPPACGGARQGGDTKRSERRLRDPCRRGIAGHLPEPGQGCPGLLGPGPVSQEPLGSPRCGSEGEGPVRVGVETPFPGRSACSSWRQTTEGKGWVQAKQKVLGMREVGGQGQG